MRYANLLMACGAMVLTPCIAQNVEGEYSGQMKCGALLTNASAGAWTQPVSIQIKAGVATWKRSDGRFLESGSGEIKSNRVQLNLSGRWNQGEANTGQWQTQADLNLSGDKLTGVATISSVDGQQKLRDCTVEALLPSKASTPNPQTTAATTSTSTPAIAAKPLKVTGPLFSTKAQLLEQTRSGKYIDLNRLPQTDANRAFAESIFAVLVNDYDIDSWALNPNTRFEYKNVYGVCRSVFEESVTYLFGNTSLAYKAELNRGTGDTGTPVEEYRAEVNKSIKQLLTARQNNWCSTRSGITHPNVTTLPKLLDEFATAFAAWAKVEHAKQQAEAQKIQAQRDAQEKATLAAENERKAKASAQQAERNLEKLKEAEAERLRVEGAAARNQQKIKALGLPSSVSTSTINYVNGMTRTWGVYRPMGQWLGLILENKRLDSIKSISHGGLYGVSIKLLGAPSGGFLFRTEGKDSFIAAIVNADGRVIPINSLAEQIQVVSILEVVVQ